MVRSSSPSLRWCFSAVSASTIISVGPRGAWPEVIFIDLSSLSFQLPAMVGAPVVEPRFSFLALTTVTDIETTPPSAPLTPSAFLTCSTTEAASASGLPRSGMSSPPPVAFAVTVTSELVTANSLSKVVFMVSVNTRVPQTKATESRTATAESAIRPLCATKLRREVFRTVLLTRSARARQSPSCGRGPGRRWARTSRPRSGRRPGRSRGPRTRRPPGRA